MSQQKHRFDSPALTNTELGLMVHQAFEQEDALDIPNAQGDNTPMPVSLAIVIAVMFIIGCSTLAWAIYWAFDSTIAALVTFSISYIVMLLVSFTAISGDLASIFDSWQRNKRIAQVSFNKLEAIKVLMAFLTQKNNNETEIEMAKILSMNRLADAKEDEILGQRKHTQLAVNERDLIIYDAIIEWLKDVYDDPTATGKNRHLLAKAPWNEGGAWGNQEWRMEAKQKMIDNRTIVENGRGYALWYDNKEMAISAQRRI